MILILLILISLLICFVLNSAVFQLLQFLEKQIKPKEEYYPVSKWWEVGAVAIVPLTLVVGMTILVLLALPQIVFWLVGIPLLYVAVPLGAGIFALLMSSNTKL